MLVVNQMQNIPSWCYRLKGWPGPASLSLSVWKLYFSLSPRHVFHRLGGGQGSLWRGGEDNLTDYNDHISRGGSE